MSRDERLWSRMSESNHLPSAVAMGVKHAAKQGVRREKGQRKENELFHSSEAFVLCL